ncbi:hypothetical protein PS887_05397 [Pseudomonas fluorescens]|nr:hypothetical protein PS887_05397 [Pseudomonas fluorescens]
MHCPQKISARHRSPVGAGLPAKAVCQSLNIQLSHRYRRQASSHIGHVLPTKNQRPAQIPCGSGLAREGCVSVTEYSTEPPLSQASQLPHWSCIAHKISAWHRSPVEAGLPAKAVCQSLNIQLSHRYRRQASSHTSHALPTKNQRPAQIPCGSGLAREGCVSVTEYSTEPPLSQAGQLPHWSCIAHKKSAPGTDPLWERACPRRLCVSH